MLRGHAAATSDAQMLEKVLLACPIPEDVGVPSPRRDIREAEILGFNRDAWVQEVSSQTLHPEVVEVQAKIS